MTHYSVFLTALFTSMLLVGLLIRFAVRLHLVDVPDARKVHQGIVPRVGGIGMVLGTVATSLLWLTPDHNLALFLGGISIIAVFGVWDDRADLSYKLKFGGQLLAVLVVVVWGDVRIDRLSMFGDTLPLFLSVPLTVFFLLGVTNAVNLSDGLDGIAAGMSLLSMVCMIALAAGTDGADVLILPMLAIMGATLGFLRYNTHPALVFMGDAGSQFLGFSLGVLAIWLSQRVNTALVPELPLLVLGLPIIDTLTVMGQRMMQGKSPFKPDKGHFHHKLLNLGMDHYEAVVAIYVVQAIFVIAAYLMRYESTAMVVGAYGLLSAVLVGGYPLARRWGWRLHKTMRPGEMSDLTQQVLGRKVWLLRIIYLLVTSLVLVLSTVGSVVPSRLAIDFAVFGLAISLCSLVGRLMRLSLTPVLQRLTIYTCAILSIFALDESSILGDVLADPDVISHGIIALAVLIAIGVRNTESKYFAVTPSDYLVMAILVAAAFLPEFRNLNYTKLVMESAVLLYGVEYVLRQHGKSALLLWGASIGVFATHGYRVLV